MMYTHSTSVLLQLATSINKFKQNFLYIMHHYKYSTYELMCMQAWLMIMAYHQTLSDQINHMSSHIKFGQTNFLHIINGKFIEFAKNECPYNF